jgi:hypothetical protein
MYSVIFENVSVAAAQDLFEIQPADDKPVVLHAVFVSGCTSETSEQLRFTVKRITTSFASGSGGSAPTPTPLIAADTAAGATAEVNNTTPATGTAATLHAEGGNLVNGWSFIPTPEMRPSFKQAEALVVKLEAAPSASTPCSGTLYFEELA